MVLSARLLYVGNKSYNVRVKNKDGAYEETGETANLATFVAYSSEGIPETHQYRLPAEIEVAKIAPFTVLTVKIDSTSGKNGDYLRVTAFGKTHYTMPKETVDKVLSFCGDID